MFVTVSTFFCSPLHPIMMPKVARTKAKQQK
jgi:hypothetical protein